MNKFYPEVGTPLYLSQRTGSYYVDMVKHPYTVIGTNNGKVQIQECKLIFSGPRYYDTLPDDIGYAWSGQSLQELESAGMTNIVIGLAILFVYLFLVAFDFFDVE